jgi:hypothetical protein
MEKYIAYHLMGKNKCRLSVMMDFITVAKSAQVCAGMLASSADNLIANGRTTLCNIHAR